MRRFLAATVFFSIIAAAPVILRADDHDEHHERKTYYDRVHKDKHDWDDHEVAAWGRYRDEHHIEAREFEKIKRHDQDDYWRWRHDHPDTH